MFLMGHAQSPLFDFQWLLPNHVVMFLVSSLTFLCQETDACAAIAPLAMECRCQRWAGIEFHDGRAILLHPCRFQVEFGAA
jgi:hypothetical protein